MKELKEDLFNSMLKEGVDAICITTNGNYTRQGVAVMGAGIALTAQQKYPKIQQNLGRYLRIMGNNVPYIIGAIDNRGEYFDVTAQDIKSKKFKCLIISFPTKNHFKENSSLELIKQSCMFLSEMADKHNLKNVYLPRPGVGLGNLNWEDVRTEIESLLDDRFTIVSKE